MPEELAAALSDSELRAKLLELVGKDLLGPAGGASEEISERNVRDRYLVGVLAPQRQQGSESASTEPSKVAEDDDDEDVPQIPDELAEGGDDAGDDGKTDQDAPVAQAVLPSSIGFSFCVIGSTKAIEVEAEWGQYLREVSGSLTHPDTGQP